MNIMIAPRSLVVLVGVSGSGKTTFARSHFSETQVVSSDQCRGFISDDPYRIDVSESAFDLLYTIVRKRLACGRTTIVDSTAVEDFARANLLKIAREFDFHKVAIVFDIPEPECVRRDSGRTKPVGERIIHAQRGDLEQAFEMLSGEGWDEIRMISQRDENEIEIEEPPSVAAAG